MIAYCICGGGGLGHVISGVLSSQGITVNLLTQKPELWDKEINVTDCNQKVYSGTINKISSNPEDVIPESDIILLTLPGFLISQELKKLAPFLKPNAIIGSVVSNTGFFIMAHNIFGDQYNLFGFQRSPYIARVQEYGKSASLLGYKSLLKIAFMRKGTDAEFYSKLFEQHLLTPIALLNNPLEATISNSNPILHPARLYSLFHNWDNRLTYPQEIFFYEEWDDLASEIYIECDNELQNIISSLPIQKEEVTPVLQYYEASNRSSLTKKMRSIQAFKGIKSPMLKTAKGFIPNVNDRYFTEDISYGLLLLKGFAEYTNTATPMIDKILTWGQEMIGKEYIVGKKLIGKDINDVTCIKFDSIGFFINL